jgi:prolyl-tRNA synthetase
MKDLYTFDYNVPAAMDTYNSVKDVYVRLFDELKLPYLVAAADSGNMGGNLSHEFHIPSPKGDDTVISCSSCEHTFNQEVVDGKASISREQVPNQESPNVAAPKHESETVGTRMFISEDRRTLVRARYPKYLIGNEGSPGESREINPYAVRSISHAHGVELDLGVQAPLEAWQGALERLTDPEVEVEGGKGSQIFTVLDIFDYRVPAPDSLDPPELLSCDISDKVGFNWVGLDNYPGTSNLLDLVEPKSGDVCPECGEKSLQVHTTIELAHTFHLGTRYSDVLDATIGVNPAALGETTMTGRSNAIVPLQMGCHGIGVSRMISAVADALADSSGLNWPRVIAPFEVAVIPAKGLEKEAEGVYDAITTHHHPGAEAILDDRDKPMAWKLGDADLIGYPILVVVGKAWSSERKVEVQCRRQNSLRTTVALDELPGLLVSLLEKL